MNRNTANFTAEDLVAAMKRMNPEKFIAKAKPLDGVDGCKVTPPPYVRTPEQFIEFVERTAS